VAYSCVLKMEPSCSSEMWGDFQQMHGTILQGIGGTLHMILCVAQTVHVMSMYFFKEWRLDQSKLQVLIFARRAHTLFDLLKRHAKAVVPSSDYNFSNEIQCRKWIVSFFVHYGLLVSSVWYCVYLTDVTMVQSLFLIRQSEWQRLRRKEEAVKLLTYIRYYQHFVLSSMLLVPVTKDHATNTYRWHE
jgi:hypothetical protein